MTASAVTIVNWGQKVDRSSRFHPKDSYYLQKHAEAQDMNHDNNNHNDEDYKSTAL